MEDTDIIREGEFFHIEINNTLYVAQYCRIDRYILKLINIRSGNRLTDTVFQNTTTFSDLKKIKNTSISKITHISGGILGTLEYIASHMPEEYKLILKTYKESNVNL